MEKEFKYSLGLFLIFCHLLIIISLIILRILNGYIQEEFSTLIGLIIPMFSGFTTSVVMFIIEDKNNTDADNKPNSKKKELTFAFRFLSFLVPSIFVVTILVGIWLQGYKVAFKGFEDFKSFLLSVESLFSIYCGYFVYSLFKKANPSGTGSASASPPAGASV